MSEKMKRREFLPLAGVGAVLAPTILTSCSSPTESEPLYVPGTIAFERRPSYSSDETQRNIYIMDWSAETQINLTAEIPGSQGRPFWSPDGTELYFDTVLDGKGFIQIITDLTDPEGSLETILNLPEGHQVYPIVHPNGNLLVYSQTNGLDRYSSGVLVAYDMSSGQELSRNETAFSGMINNNNSNDRQFLIVHPLFCKS